MNPVLCRQSPKSLGPDVLGTVFPAFPVSPDAFFVGALNEHGPRFQTWVLFIF
jgi:hypothetical protein